MRIGISRDQHRRHGDWVSEIFVVWLTYLWDASMLCLCLWKSPHPVRLSTSMIITFVPRPERGPQQGFVWNLFRKQNPTVWGNHAANDIDGFNMIKTIIPGRLLFSDFQILKSDQQFFRVPAPSRGRWFPDLLLGSKGTSAAWQTGEAGQGLSGIVRDGQGWSGMVRDGQGWSGMVRDGQGP